MRKLLLVLLVLLSTISAFGQTEGVANFPNPVRTVHYENNALPIGSVPIWITRGRYFFGITTDTFNLDKQRSLNETMTNKLLWIKTNGDVSAFIPDYLRPTDTVNKWLGVGTVIPAAQVNTDWNSVSGPSQLLNKPNLNIYYLNSNPSGFISGIDATMVTTALGYTPPNANGSISQYMRGDGSLATFPSIPAAQVNSDWNSNINPSQILNKPNLSAVALSGAYSDLSGTPNLSIYYLASNPSGYISGINSGMVTTALGFTPVPNSRTLTINGTTQDLTTDRTWNVGTVTSVGSTNGDLSVSTATTTPSLTINSAPKLTTARTINGQSFDGTANITIPGSAITSIPNSSLTNVSVTINGNSVALGGSTIITASPNVSAPSAGNTITMGTAFQPRSGGPCWVAVNASITGALGLNETITVAMSSTSGGNLHYSYY